MTLLAALLPLGALASFSALVLRLRRRPLPLAVAVALGMLVAWDTVALNVLSLFAAVEGPWLAGVQAVPIVAWVAARARGASGDDRRGARRLRLSVRGLGVPGLVTLPLLAITLVSASRYAPQNWDSMTYRLARVAHWLQNGSVQPFRTHIPRQNFLGPGAEYLVLTVQGIAGSDLLANGVQWGCLVLLAWSAPSLGRLMGAPRAFSAWLAPLVVALPMAVLQASTTQNDLVASVLTVALVAAAAPFLHRARTRWRPADAVLLGVLGAAAFLVKLPAVVAAAPVLLWAVACALPSLLAGERRARRWRGLAIGLLACAVVTAPYAVGLAGTRIARSGEYTYAGIGDWGDRGVNLLRGLAHHLPVSPRTAQRLGIVEKDAARWPAVVLSRHEDYAGNPVQLAVALALGLAAAVRWRRLGALARGSVLAGLCAWIVFHALLRENIWFSRLQTPLFVVGLPLLGAALASGLRVVLARAAGPLLALPAVAHGLFVAVGADARPPFASPPWVASREASYYLLRPGVAPEHELALDAARQLGCARIGLYVTEDSYDYPLTWRAMQRGVATRHVFFDGDGAWPCIVVSDLGPPPPVQGLPWLRASEQVYLQNPRAIPSRSSR